MTRLHRHQTSRRDRTGYTLIELLIVVALLGLAGTLVIPRIGQPDELSIQAACRRVISDLSFAQSDALARQDVRRVHFFDDGSGYAILQSPFDPSTDYIFDPLAPSGSDGGYIVDFTSDDRFAGIQVEDVNIDGGERFVSYDELGGTVTAGGTAGTGGYIQLQSTTKTYRINIAAFTGKLTVQEL